MNRENYSTPVRNATCPNCGRPYSREDRIARGCDEEYCCDMCKHEAEESAEQQA